MSLEVPSITSVLPGDGCLMEVTAVNGDKAKGVSRQGVMWAKCFFNTQHLRLDI